MASAGKKKRKQPKQAQKSADRPWSDWLLHRLRSAAHEWGIATKHPVLVGTARERALIRLVQDVLPRQYEALDGAMAIVDANGNPRVMREQYDLLIADTFRHPVLLRVAGSAIVLPQAVRVIAEIKSELTRPFKPAEAKKPGAAHVGAAGRVPDVSASSLAEALFQLGRLAPLSATVAFTARRMLFAYAGPSKLDTLEDWFKDVVAAHANPTKFGLSGDQRAAFSAAGIPDVVCVLEAGLYAWKQGAKLMLTKGKPTEVVAQILGDVLAEVHEESRPAPQKQSELTGPLALDPPQKVSLGAFLQDALRQGTPRTVDLPE